jgi:hypothetical protein
VSGQQHAQAIDLAQVDAADGPGIAGGDVLGCFVDAVMQRDEPEIARHRSELADRLGSAAVTDTAAVLACFERMNRFADATGIPLDGPVEIGTRSLRQTIGADALAGAARGPQPGRFGRWLGRRVERIVPALMRLGAILARWLMTRLLRHLTRP